MADDQVNPKDRLTTDDRLDRIEEAMVYFNRRQNADIALSQEMRLDFQQEFREIRRIVIIMAVALFLTIISMAVESGYAE